MAKELIAALRHHQALKHSTRAAAIELAHRANDSGTVRMSYTLLAAKCNVSRRTAIRAVAWLVDHHYLKKTVCLLRAGWCALNQYVFTIPWTRSPTAAPARRPHGSSGDIVTPTLPTPENARMKMLSLREEIQALTRGMTLLEPGSTRYQDHQAELDRLQALLR